MSTFAVTLQSFFTTYLIGQKAASQHTIAAYRDTFRLLLVQIHHTTGTTPDAMEFADVNAEAITSFLTYLENVRKNTVRTRNARLAALHAFFNYAAYRHPEHADLIARVLAIKTKNTTTTILSYLTQPEVNALLGAPDQNTVTGRRDHVMMMVFISTGLRVSELIGLTQQDLQLTTPAHLLCHGKGRKDRITPLNKETTRALRMLRASQPDALPHDPLFTAQGSTKALGRDAIAARLRLYCATATATSPSLKNKSITPHTLRHYVDGWVMWPDVVFPLAGVVMTPIPAT
jgi:integrase/recombinase XerD